MLVAPIGPSTRVKPARRREPREDPGWMPARIRRPASKATAYRSHRSGIAAVAWKSAGGGTFRIPCLVSVPTRIRQLRSATPSEKHSNKCDLLHRSSNAAVLDLRHDQDLTKAITETDGQRQCRLRPDRHQRRSGPDRVDLSDFVMISNARLPGGDQARRHRDAFGCCGAWFRRRCNFFRSLKNPGSGRRFEIASSAMRHDQVSSTGNESNRA
jgi:hypothetical protein